MQSALEAEATTQPDDWRRAATQARTYAHLLPAPGERVAVVGCGTSLAMAQAWAALREQAGHGLTDAWSPTDVRLGRGYDRVVALTRSGTTTEVVDLLATVQGRLPATVLTATPGTPVTALADAVLMPEVDERSVVATRFATTSLALLRWHLGEDLDPVADQAAAALRADVGSFAAAVEADQVTFVGRGWAAAIAAEAALKVRESTQAWTESYSMYEYRHGPRSVSRPGRVVWAFGPLVDDLADDVAATGATLLHADVDPMADLVRVHRLCALRGAAAGIDVDHPPHLTRSIVLGA